MYIEVSNQCFPGMGVMSLCYKVQGWIQIGGDGGKHPSFDFDNRSVTQAQGYFFSFSPVIL